VRVALSDVAFWMVGNLGKIAEVEINRHERVKDGNYLYGAFGRDFRTRDGRRIMIVALTSRQWNSLVAATDLGEAFASIEKDDGRRPRTTRADASPPASSSERRSEPWVLSRSIAEVREIFDAHDVCWGPYQTFTELVEQDPRCSPANPLFASVEQPGIGTYRMPGSPLVFGSGRAPRA
jgi:2-methylfumaryl-CoA isomerase